MNRIPVSFPMGATWRLLGSSAWKPTKQPPLFAAVASLVDGNGMRFAVMFGGTSVRNGWPLAKKVDSSSFMKEEEDDELLSLRRRLLSSTTLGAMESFHYSCLALCFQTVGN